MICNIYPFPVIFIINPGLFESAKVKQPVHLSYNKSWSVKTCIAD